MPTIRMPVAQRIALLQQIFNEFGVPVVANSPLDLAIRNEFGPGKRSKINKILEEYTCSTDAAMLSACIGSELQKDFADPQLCAVGKVLRERIPSVLEILDIRQQTQRREFLLRKVLEHISAKLPKKEYTDRLHRMLDAAGSQLHANMHGKIYGSVAEHAGAALECAQLRSFGVILQSVTPALLSLEIENYDVEISTNHCIHALRTIAHELHSVHLGTAADIIDNIHWLAKINLPQLTSATNVDQALTALDIPFANLTVLKLRDKARAIGLHDDELLQVLHANRQYAATSGMLAKMGRDINCPILEKIGVSGLCLLTLKQTYDELRTGNLEAANFSESLGIAISGLGTITNNRLLSKIGKSITNGVKVYAGIMAVPGGASVAIPLAICTVVGSILIKNKSVTNKSVQQNIVDITVLQREMRWQFSELYQQLAANNREIIEVMDQGFAKVIDFMARYQTVQLQKLTLLTDIHINISKEFTDLYLEYVREPLDELKYYENYNEHNLEQLGKIKSQLNMWLLYKSRHSKANGRNIDQKILQNVTQPESLLGLINHYISLEFNQQYSEELPHLPSWMMAAEGYLTIGDRVHNIQEERLIQDIIAVGVEVIDYINAITNNHELLQQIEVGLQEYTHEEALIMQALNPKAPDINLIPEASPAPWHLQYERFAPLDWDISDLWPNYQIPTVYYMAQHYKLGKIFVWYLIEPSNLFNDEHLPYSNMLLPDYSRIVKFRIEVHFKHNSDQKNYLLANSLHHYDLVTVQNRFEQYYRGKFKFALKHTRYLWISKDGLQNHVQGYPVAATQKPIDYTRLATVYRGWFDQANMQELNLVPQEALLYQLQASIVQKQILEQDALECAMQSNVRLQLVLDKLATYRSIRAALAKLTDGEILDRFEYMVIRLRLRHANLISHNLVLC